MERGQILAIQVRCCLITETVTQTTQSAGPSSVVTSAQSIEPTFALQMETLFAKEAQIAGLKDRVKTSGLDHYRVSTKTEATCAYIS